MGLRRKKQKSATLLATEALAMFTNAVEKLTESSEVANTIINSNKSTIGELRDSNRDLEETVSRNDRMIGNISSLLND